MSDNAIRLVEGDNNVVYTITCKRAGSAINLTGTTVDLFARDDDDSVTSNQVDASSCTITDGPNGIVTHSFTSTHTDVSGTERDLRGHWRIRITSGADIEWLKREPFYIERNRMV